MSFIAGKSNVPTAILRGLSTRSSSKPFKNIIFPSLSEGRHISSTRVTRSHSNLSNFSYKHEAFRVNLSSSTLFPFRQRHTNPLDYHQSRSFQTSAILSKALRTEAKIPRVWVESGILFLSFFDKTIDIPLLWLRDHCHCSVCFNHDTSQKNVDARLMELDLSDARVQFDESQDSLEILWKDDHTSTFTLKEIKEWFYPGSYSQRSKPFLWNCATLNSQDIPSVSFDEHLNSESGLKQTISDLVTYGFTFVDETPVSEEATQTVSERVGRLMPTIYGKGVWMLSSNAELYKDSAYKHVGLGAHTDLTYNSSAAGIQVFHGMGHDGSGGETLLVDGFNAANILLERHPESFDCLASFIVPHEYKEPKSDKSPGYHLYNLCSVLTTHPNSRELIQIRFNPYDRAPLNTISPDKIQEFCVAYDRLSRIIQDPANEFWIKLTPGRVLFIDNWRVMHGRSAFTGLRTLCGCYLQRDEWVSKARVFGLF